MGEKPSVLEICMVFLLRPHFGKPANPVKVTPSFFLSDRGGKKITAAAKKFIVAILFARANHFVYTL